MIVTVDDDEDGDEEEPAFSKVKAVAGGGRLLVASDESEIRCGKDGIILFTVGPIMLLLFVKLTEK